MQNKTILLFGMPRSGTTWIGKLFDSHPDTYYLHEPDSVEPDYSLPLLLNDEMLPNYQAQIKQLVSQWMQVKQEKVIASRPFFKKSYMNQLQWHLFQLSAFASKALAGVGIQPPFHPVRWHQHSKPQIIVWKSIESLGRIGALSRVANALPIQLIRHPCGNISSTFKGEAASQFDGSVATSEDWDLYQKLIEQSGNKQFDLDSIKAMPTEQRLTVRWGLINDFAIKQIEKLNGKVIKYEDICREPLQEIEQIFNWAGLNPTQSTKAFVQESTTGHDDAYYSTRKNPLVSAYSWKKQLTAEQIVNIRDMMLHFRSGELYVDDF